MVTLRQGTDIQILIHLLEDRAHWTEELAMAMPWVSDWDQLRRQVRKVLRRDGRVLEGIVRGSQGQTLWGIGRDWRAER